MDFPFPVLHGLEDAQRNFEALTALGIYGGTGAPAFVPAAGKGSYYLRRDTPSTVNQRIYVWTGTAWTGIL